MQPVPPQFQMTFEQQRAYVKAWKARAHIYEEIRTEQARDSDTVRDIPCFNGLFEMAVRDCPPEPTSGLVAFHRRLKNPAISLAASSHDAPA